MDYKEKISTVKSFLVTPIKKSFWINCIQLAIYLVFSLGCRFIDGNIYSLIRSRQREISVSSRQVALEFVDVSSAQAMVKRFIRDVKARSERIRTEPSHRKLIGLLCKLKTKKYPKSKQSKHFCEVVKVLAGAEPVIVIQSPNKLANFGLLMVVRVDENDLISFDPLFIDYKNRNIVSSYTHNWSNRVVINDNHVLERFLERENVTDVALALYVLLLTWFTNYRELEGAGIGDKSLVAHSGGMFLGDVRDEKIDGKYVNTFTVKTYLERKKVRDHNWFMCANPNDKGVYTPSYWESMKSAVMEDGYILF